MPITRVEYSRLVSFVNHEKRRFGGAAEVPDGGNLADTMATLREWVDAQANEILSLHGEYSIADRDLTLKRNELSRVEAQIIARSRDLAELKSRWERARAFLAKHGVQGDIFEEIPF